MINFDSVFEMTLDTLISYNTNTSMIIPLVQAKPLGTNHDIRVQIKQTLCA